MIGLRTRSHLLSFPPPLPPSPFPLRLLITGLKILRVRIKKANLLSTEKESVGASAANKANATSSSTPRKSRPITTLFLLSAVSFVPSFHHCVTVHHHHPTQRHHHRCQPLGASCHDSSSLSFSPCPFLFRRLSRRISINNNNNNNNNNPRCDRTRQSLMEPQKTMRSSSLHFASVFAKLSVE